MILTNWFCLDLELQISFQKQILSKTLYYFRNILNEMILLSSYVLLFFSKDKFKYDIEIEATRNICIAKTAQCMYYVKTLITHLKLLSPYTA